jgi:hypothetical protein
MTKDRYLAAPRFAEYLESVEKNRDMWRALADRARVGDDVLQQLRELPPLRLLALSEDWCGDAINTLPIISRMAEEVPYLDFRVLDRDANPDLMDAHLTNGSRSIPVVIVYDETFQELGYWGPRPTELQSWVLGSGLQMPSKDRYREVRRWYAKDRGRTTAHEVLAEIQTAIRRRAA